MLFRIYFAFKHGSQLSHVSGVWLALTQDLADGLFYRPVFSVETGFGGTRYFPLHFALNALLYKIFGDLLIAGFAVTLLSIVFFLSGLFQLLRSIGLDRQNSGIFALLACSGMSMQLAFTTIRGDLLPLALLVWAFVFCLKRGRKNLVLASLFFILAFSAKVTAIYAPLVAVMWLLANRQRKEAFTLASLFTTGAAVILALTETLSEGRFSENFLSMASGGGFSFITNLSEAFFKGDPVALLVFISATISLVFLKFKAGNFAMLWLITTIAATFVILSSHGTDYNQFIDLQAASILMLAQVFLNRKTSSQSWLVLAVAMLGAILVSALILIKEDIPQDRIANIKQVIATLPKTKSNYLSEDPLLPILAKHPVYILDPFSMKTVRKSFPESNSELFKGMETYRYAQVILLKNPDIKPRWYTKFHFGEGFVEKLKQTHPHCTEIGHYLLYNP